MLASFQTQSTHKGNACDSFPAQDSIPCSEFSLLNSGAVRENMTKILIPQKREIKFH